MDMLDFKGFSARIENLLKRICMVYEDATKFSESLSLTLLHGSKLLESYTAVGQYMLEEGGEIEEHGENLLSVIDAQQHLQLSIEEFNRKFCKLMDKNLNVALQYWKFKIDFLEKEFNDNWKPSAKKLQERVKKLMKIYAKLEVSTSESKTASLTLDYNKALTKKQEVETLTNTICDQYIFGVEKVHDEMLQKTLFIISEGFKYQTNIFDAMKEIEDALNRFISTNYTDTEHILTVQNIRTLTDNNRDNSSDSCEQSIEDFKHWDKDKYQNSENSDDGSYYDEDEN